MPDWDMNGEITKAGFAAQIATLREENATLRACLEKAREVVEPFSAILGNSLSALPDDFAVIVEIGDELIAMPLGHFRRAAAWRKEDGEK